MPLFSWDENDYIWNGYYTDPKVKTKKPIENVCAELGVDLKELAVKKGDATMSAKATITEQLPETTSTVTPKINLPGTKPSTDLFLHMIAKRVNNPHGIFQLTIKSSVFEDYFRSISPDKELLESSDFKKACWEMPKAKKPDGSSIQIVRINQPINLMSGKFSDSFLLSDFLTPNMTILSAIGLKDGVDFVFGELYQKESIEKGLNEFFSRAKKIYKEYIKQVTVEFDVRVKEVS